MIPLVSDLRLLCHIARGAQLHAIGLLCFVCPFCQVFDATLNYYAARLSDFRVVRPLFVYVISLSLFNYRHPTDIITCVCSETDSLR